MELKEIRCPECGRDASTGDIHYNSDAHMFKCSSCGKEFEEQIPVRLVKLMVELLHNKKMLETSTPAEHFSKPITAEQAPVVVTSNVASSKGKMLLIIAGIFYILFSVISLLSSTINLLSIDTWLPFFGGQTHRNMWHTYYAAVIFYAVFTLFIGIMGIVHCTNIKLANKLQWLVISEVGVFIFLNFVVFNTIGATDILGGWTSWLTPITLTFGLPGLPLLLIDLALYVLYITGASLNTKIKEALKI